MNLIERVKNILVSPKTEWDVIDNESATPTSLLTGYILPLSLIGAIASFIGLGIIGINVMGVHIGSITLGIGTAVQTIITAILSFYICTYVVDALAPTFNSEKNINKSAQLVAYGSTAGLVAGILNILPSLSMLILVAALYGIYLFYLGVPKIKKTPEEKVIPYMIVTGLVVIAVGFLIGLVLTPVIYAIIGNPYSSITGM